VRPGRHGEAVKILEQLGGANRLDSSQRFLLAQLYLGERNEEKYQSEMLKLLELKARSPQHLAHFVNYWIGRNQLDQADRWLAELKKAEPRGLPALELEAKLLDRRKRKPELLALLEARGREVPDQIGPLADLLSRYEFAKEAETAYRAFIAREPKQPERVLGFAQFLARQDRGAEAMGILRRAWSTCRPEQVAVAALSMYSTPATGEAEKREVERWLTEAARERPEAFFLIAKLGVILVRQGRFDEAEKLFRKLLSANPDEVDALNGLAWLVVMRDQSTVRDALGLINHAIDIRGPDPTLLDTRAMVLIRSGQADEAVRDLREAQKLNPANPNPFVHLALAYRMSGRFEDAKKVFRQAAELGWSVANSDPLERGLLEKLRQDLELVPN
jgi:Flp pilus assembly protein TadD